MIIAISGIDSAGKTTQIQALLKYYESKGYLAIRLWSRGGYTPLYNWLKTVIRFLFKRKLPVPGKTEQREKLLHSRSGSTIWLTIAIVDLILYYGVYMRLLVLLFRKIIIADRYLIDTYIDFRLNFKNVKFYRWRLWKMLLYIAPKPGISFLLTIPLHEAEIRAEIKNEPYPDGKEIRTRRYRYYRLLSKKTFRNIDCMQSIESVTSTLITFIENPAI